MKLAVVFATLALLVALPARADAIYDVSGTATITGSDACGGPCVEVVNFTLQLDQPNPFTTEVLPGGTFSSSGPIPFGSGNIQAGPLDDEAGSFNLGVNGDVFEQNLGCEGTSPFPCTPSLGWVILSSCGDVTCAADFFLMGCAIDALDNGGLIGGTVVGTLTLVEPPSTPTPEPGESSLLILGIGLLALAGCGARARQRSRAVFSRQLASIA